MLKLRINIRNRFLLFFMLTKIQTVKGMSTQVYNEHNRKTKKHYIYWDMDNCSLNQAENELKSIQMQYDLGNIYITSDKENSYRAQCFNKISFSEYIRILANTKYVDDLYLMEVFRRREGILRLSPKRDREPQKVVSILSSYYNKIPTKFKAEIYQTHDN